MGNYISKNRQYKRNLQTIPQNSYNFYTRPNHVIVLDGHNKQTEPKRFKYEEGVAPQLQKLSSAKRFFFLLAIIPDIKEVHFNVLFNPVSYQV